MVREKKREGEREREISEKLSVHAVALRLKLYEEESARTDIPPIKR